MCGLYSHPVPVPRSKTIAYLKDSQGRVIARAKLAEAPLAQDPTSIHGNLDVPPFHGYSKKGMAEGQLVYAHVSTDRASQILSNDCLCDLAWDCGGFRAIKGRR